MIREIKYNFNKTVDNFTCHALFSKITDGALSKLSLNSHSKQPEYKVSFQDRLITILINEDDFKLDNLPTSVQFNHCGEKINGFLTVDSQYINKKTFNVNDYLTASGVICYTKKHTTDNKNKSPINPLGQIINTEKNSIIQYLEEKTGLDISKQIDEKNFRIKMISYKNFENRSPVYSKSNHQKISINNVFSFIISGYVKDADSVNSLEYRSIGKKRSYGLGNIYLT